MVFHIDILCVDLQRLEGLAAVLIELSEELQALQTEVMHKAAQQVQREVERVTHKAFTFGICRMYTGCKPNNQ